MAIAVGLDCGGTSSRAMALDDSGAIVFSGQSGAANWASTPRDALTQHLREALANCPPPEAVCGCFAGLLTDSDASQASRLLQEITGCSRVAAYPDTRAVLAAAGPDATLAVIAGTGSSIFSMHDGKFVRTGGGGPLLGDAGSAFSLVRTVVTDWLSEGDIAEEMRPACQQVFGTTDLYELIALAYQNPTPAGFLAQLAPEIGRAGHALNINMLACMTVEMAKLGVQICAHIRRFHPTIAEPKIALAGGVWDISSFFAEKLSEMVADELERSIDMYKIPKSPVWGAAQLARELLK